MATAMGATAAGATKKISPCGNPFAQIALAADVSGIKAAWFRRMSPQNALDGLEIAIRRLLDEPPVALPDFAAMSTGERTVWLRQQKNAVLTLHSEPEVRLATKSALTGSNSATPFTRAVNRFVELALVHPAPNEELTDAAHAVCRESLRAFVENV